MASRSILVLNSLKNSSNLSIRSKVLLSNSNKLSYLNASLANKSISTTASLQLNKQLNLLKIHRASIHLTPKYFNEIVTVECPAFAESIKEGNILLLKKIGDTVALDEDIAKIETDKTNMDVKAPMAGVIEAFLVEEGATVTANMPIIKIRAGASSNAAPAQQASPPPSPQQSEKKPEPVQEKKQTSTPTSMPPAPPIPTKPLSTISLSQIPVTPFKAQPTAKADISKITGTRTETRVKMSKMRQTISRRLKESQNQCAMLTTFNEINMGNLVDLRKTYGEQFHKKHSLKLGFMSAFVKAAATALTDQPVVNAVIENNEIIYRDFVDISVAVATPRGLVVPVLRNVEKMGYADIEKEIAALGEKARHDKIAIEDMQGGTFTISNGGVFGSLFGTPIINLPQSAILGMHGIFDRPIAINGQVVIRPMMYVALTYDHRLIDGREAVIFLRKIKSAVEDPRTLLLDI